VLHAKKGEKMKLKSRGIYVSHDDVLNGTLDRSKLEAAGYTLMYPISGYLYFEDTGESYETVKPFWFLPIQNPYNSPDKVAAEVTRLYPEVFYELNVAERLVRANMVVADEGGKNE
jgi:hypothetical protein